MKNELPINELPFNESELPSMADDAWMPDRLGDGLEMTYVPMPDDYSGPVRCTVIRKRLEGAEIGVLYIHGFSDYFFQREMADEFVAHGYSFYAVDLRKYGRSYMPGQKMFQVRDISEYFADIQAGIDCMKADGCREVVLIGHSTGGLSSSLYMQQAPDPVVKALVLNSPFLAWNLPAVMREAGVPVVSALGRIFPGLPMKSGGTIHYNAAIARHLGGEWEYDPALKPDIMSDVDAGWIRAIDRAQKALLDGGIKVPVLLLHSERSVRPGDPLERYHDSDGVLDVRLIAEAGRKLGPDVTEVTVRGGLHDLILSRREVRDKVYDVIFHWLSFLGKRDIVV